jgi:hypothetical protein
MRCKYGFVGHEVSDGAARNHADNKGRKLSGTERQGYQTLVLVPDGLQELFKMGSTI